MSLTSRLLTTLAAATIATAAFAQGTITVDDAYARSSGKSAKAGAAFMMIQNTGATDDRLIGVESDAAARVELHTHIVDENGIAKMTRVEEGISIPAGETHMLKRGGDHVMFMGLTAPFEQDAMVPVTLIFETAGKVEIEIPVDLVRKDTGGHGSHSN
ncbi:copper chaperone PCu(A)C [Ruegeria atlantica]|uniref:copper chaperone PCu(A)C n=1 Tax=Ruegeria atlantica TaxID=81569 RepID=UPI0024940FAF|nr:copper chaperone PCu(A)C [Ruegeria atlantica]